MSILLKQSTANAFINQHSFNTYQHALVSKATWPTCKKLYWSICDMMQSLNKMHFDQVIQGWILSLPPIYYKLLTSLRRHPGLRKPLKITKDNEVWSNLTHSLTWETSVLQIFGLKVRFHALKSPLWQDIVMNLIDAHCLQCVHPLIICTLVTMAIYFKM